MESSGVLSGNQRFYNKYLGLAISNVMFLLGYRNIIELFLKVIKHGNGKRFPLQNPTSPWFNG
jgi:hypothetical protein